MNTSNNFPIFVISKGRWERRQTVKTMDKMGLEYKVVIEPSEYEKYASVIPEKRILVTPENFSEYKQGSVPVRNFVWNRAVEMGVTRHWILDDNIESVERFNKNLRIPCACPAPFVAMEDFVLRYKNIALAGPNYSLFCPANEARPPFQMNTRVYSCILVNHEIPFRWRGKYNEDTDLSLRCLKAGWNTVLFNAFLIGKRATMTQGGGNTDTIYDTGDERLEFAESLYRQHPDVVNVTRKFNRWHHHVNYKPFKGRALQYVEGYKQTNDVDNFGMVLRRKQEQL
jgi:hypothetical protein|tara:strand:- start:5 stop:856 length:852 start_codon:yes stop_codon:yes gene_type:complete